MEVGMTFERSTGKHNLPAPVSSFIGREQELREIGQRLTEHRLLPLTGAGGTGKTRLALQVATAERERFADGVWLVELAELRRPELVGETLATVLAVPETAEPPLEERLCAALSAKHSLLVLDNCEHLLDACARLVARLLARCPGLPSLPPDTVFLFPSGKTKNALAERALGYIVKTYASEASLPDVSPHDLRHRFGYRMAESVPLHRLAQIMGHDSLDTTKLSIQGTKHDLQQAVETIAWT
jgi:Phage integrase family/NB-ARC domain